MSEHNLQQLEELAQQFETDKLPLGYLPLYLEYIERQGIKRDAPVNILEIGTNKGSSLRTWAEYFPNAKVYGLDVTREYEVSDLLDHSRIITSIVDAGNPSALSREVGGMLYDFIIDDGSHEQSDQQVALGVLFRHLLRGGLYVIEDLITGYAWWDHTVYNRQRITPTRGLLQIYQQTGKMVSQVMSRDQATYIEEMCEYCEYRESTEVIFDIHHPQLAFLGKKS